jgi:hypothetical protein
VESKQIQVLFVVKELCYTFSRSGNDFDRFYLIYVCKFLPLESGPLSKMIGYH